MTKLIQVQTICSLYFYSGYNVVESVSSMSGPVAMSCLDNRTIGSSLITSPSQHPLLLMKWLKSFLTLALDSPSVVVIPPVPMTLLLCISLTPIHQCLLLNRPILRITKHSGIQSQNHDSSKLEPQTHLFCGAFQNQDFQLLAFILVLGTLAHVDRWRGFTFITWKLQRIRMLIPWLLAPTSHYLLKVALPLLEVLVVVVRKLQMQAA